MRETSLYDQVGGHATFVRLVEEFYRGLADDPVLRPMYPEDLSDATDRMVWFLEQYWGGPDSYSTHRGHPALRMRHAHFQIDVQARDHWLMHMNAAIDSLALPEALAGQIREHIDRVAHFLRNVAEPDEQDDTPDEGPR